MEGAWAAFIMWASREPDVLARYRGETGYTSASAESFVVWVTETLWGMEEAPAAFRAHVAELRARASGAEAGEGGDG